MTPLDDPRRMYRPVDVDERWSAKVVGWVDRRLRRSALAATVTSADEYQGHLAAAVLADAERRLTRIDPLAVPVHEAAERVGCRPSEVLDRIDRGELAHISSEQMCGGPTRVPVWAVDEWRATRDAERTEARRARAATVALLGLSALYRFAFARRDRLGAARAALAPKVPATPPRVTATPWRPTRPMVCDGRPPPTPERYRPAVMLTGPPVADRDRSARTPV